MGEDNNDSATVVQLLTSWLARVESKIDLLTGKLEGKADKTELAELRQALENKADKTDLVELEHRVGSEAKRTDTIEKDYEHHSRSQTEKKEWRQYVMPLIISLALLAIGVLQVMK